MIPMALLLRRPALFAGLVLGAFAALSCGVASARAQGMGQSFKDCDECPVMVEIPPGSFVMGSPVSEPGRDSDEGPPRRVTIGRGFAIGKFEVTRDEFAAFVGEAGHAMPGSCSPISDGSDDGRSWRFPGFAQSGREPVTCVRWADAEAYARWLSRKTGQAYRLPSEAEWEYAARAGTETARYWGRAIGQDRANCDGCGSAWDDRRTAPVGSFAPNAFGLHDVLGNNWEWVADCYLSSYAGAPLDGRPRLEGDCGYRVVRGGSWESDTRRLRAANRNKLDEDDIDDDFGFRVVRELGSKVPPSLVSGRPTGQDIGTLEIMGPNVTINREPASNGMRVKAGDYIATGSRSRAKISLFDGGFLLLEENTDPTLWDRLLATGECIIAYVLDSGTGAGETGDCKIDAATPSSDNALIGSKYILTAGPVSTSLTILEGQATIRGEREVTVRAGHQVVMSRDAITVPRRLHERETGLLNDYLDSFDFTGERSPIWPVSVPRVEGLSFEEAARNLSRAGLGLERVGDRGTERFPPGAIAEQRPAAGSVVPPGTAVHVYIAVQRARDPVTPISVPAIEGRSFNEAARILSRLGLTLRQIDKRPTTRFPPGTIVEQRPPAGTPVARGTEVRVIVGAEPAPVEVPFIEGRSLEEAAGILSSRGLKLRRIGERPTTRLPPGTIAEQRQRAGSLVPRGTAVQVIVWARPTPVEVPYIVGRHFKEAAGILSRRGLTLRQIDKRITTKFPPDAVVEQRPAARTKVAPGSVVRVIVAVAPVSMVPPPLFLPPVEVPYIVGKSFKEAANILSPLGLKLEKVGVLTTKQALPGTIVKQSPGARTKVTRGTAVKVYLEAAGGAGGIIQRIQ